ncbi:GNAT family N-acetyltransferase [Maribacter sp. 2308TA10-17]|uniref:GNAT family N-acetyltransferase n=1 Tax=Maribacter sp. 2308TA10-17 TaxID=3386276 RepID=UPI0039BC5D36
MPLRFQKCALTHLDQLIEISKTTFVNAFEKDNNPEDFETYIDAAFDKSTIKEQLVNPNSSFYFAIKDEALAGYFKLNAGDAQTDIKSEEAIELERIYVLQEFQGKQIGKMMLQKAIEIAGEKHKRYIWLGVWEENTDAIRFYQRHNFTKFATHPYFIGKDKQTDWLMRFEIKKPLQR